MGSLKSAVVENTVETFESRRTFQRKEMVLGRRWVLRNHFDGVPTPEDFELVEEELPPLEEDQFIFYSLYISVDPYQRPYSVHLSPPFTMVGSSLAVVEESRNAKFPKGS